MKYLFLIFAILQIPSVFAQSSVQARAIRLKPGQDIFKEIVKYVGDNKLEAYSILSAVGSVTEAHIRYANKKEGTKVQGPLEIVSLSGTGGLAGNHLHISVSDGEGKTVGGHLLEGTKVFTTLELVLGVYPDVSFKRTLDPTFGYSELDVKSLK